MSTATIVLVIVLIVAALAIATALYLRNRRATLQRRFGPEYERAVDEHGGRFRAEQELTKRQRMRDELDIHPLSARSRERYRAEWAAIQQLFVDDPPQGLARADRLVTDLLGERGYPADDRRKQEATLSVEHAGVMDRYREAHEITALNTRGHATTEQLRRATVDYRSLVEQLLADGAGPSRHDEQRHDQPRHDEPEETS